MGEKVDLTPIQVLELIRLGIKNGNYEAAIAVCDDAIADLKARGAKGFTANEPIEAAK